MKFLAGIISFFVISWIGGLGSIENINGIWIPQSINWKSGSFETLYIYNDTLFIKIASTNVKLKNDSIELITEPGFVLSSGKLTNSNNKVKQIAYRIMYRFIKLTGEKIPSNTIIDSLKISKEYNHLIFDYSGKKYIKVSKLTSRSNLQLNIIIKKFLPRLLNDEKLKSP